MSLVVLLCLLLYNSTAIVAMLIKNISIIKLLINAELHTYHYETAHNAKKTRNHQSVMTGIPPDCYFQAIETTKITQTLLQGLNPWKPRLKTEGLCNLEIDIEHKCINSTKNHFLTVAKYLGRHVYVTNM